jgi:hypothetical protein
MNSRANMMVKYWRHVVINEKRQEDFDRMEYLTYDAREDMKLMKH